MNKKITTCLFAGLALLIAGVCQINSQTPRGNLVAPPEPTGGFTLKSQPWPWNVSSTVINGFLSNLNLPITTSTNATTSAVTLATSGTTTITLQLNNSVTTATTGSGSLIFTGSNSLVLSSTIAIAPIGTIQTTGSGLRIFTTGSTGVLVTTTNVRTF